MLPIALISPSALVLAGLRDGLTRLGGFDMRLCSRSLEEAREAGFALADVAIVDLGGDSEAWSDDHDDSAGPPLVLLVSPSRSVSSLLRDGCSVLPADAPIGMLAAAAQAAAAGLVTCTPQMAAQALRVDPGHSEASMAYEPLTPREREVLAQMSFGLGNREIADCLHISPHTAKFHVAQIISKLDASSRAHAVAKALRAGLVAA